MRTLLIITILLTICSCSQRVTLSGTALAVQFKPVFISVNDTFRKIADDGTISRKKIYKMMDNNKYAATTDFKGKYTIRPKKTDTLYFKALWHAEQKLAVSDILKQKYKYLQLEKKPPCDTTRCHEKNPVLYAIIGTKIAVERLEWLDCPNFLYLDSKFSATFSVLEDVIGNYEKDTINFLVYDHYGRPAFEEFENVLLYLVESCGELIHVKYQYADVYKTIDGRWAAPYQSIDYNKRSKRGLPETIQPELIAFAKPVEFSIKGADKEWVKQMYPEPFYEIKGDKAIAVYGNYAEDVVKLKMQVTADGLK